MFAWTLCNSGITAFHPCSAYETKPSTVDNCRSATGPSRLSSPSEGSPTLHEPTPTGCARHTGVAKVDDKRLFPRRNARIAQERATGQSLGSWTLQLEGMAVAEAASRRRVAKLVPYHASPRFFVGAGTFGWEEKANLANQNLCFRFAWLVLISKDLTRSLERVTSCGGGCKSIKATRRNAREADPASSF